MFCDNDSQGGYNALPVLNSGSVHYSDRYEDEEFEYRHVILPKEFGKYVPRTHLMTETEWRNLGIQQSPGWVHYSLHGPEPHVLLFRRLLPKKEPAMETSAVTTNSTVVSQKNEKNRVLVGDLNLNCQDNEEGDDMSLDEMVDAHEPSDESSDEHFVRNEESDSDSVYECND